ncbi:hypothetical protein L596_017631 [Steinernema carpocapsae]|uniref:Uncharacterized protein n=1 Tax=Steinernema carpocapsae TaxID=34508 RepID=A0A4U5N293_STECR|nr:hypothetical protein L596_017631 [Steinernema carpocapsae]
MRLEDNGIQVDYYSNVTSKDIYFWYDQTLQQLPNLSISDFFVTRIAADSRYPCRKPSPHCFDVPEPIVQKVLDFHEDKANEAVASSRLPPAVASCERERKICVAQCLDAQDLNDNITTCEKDGDRDNVPTLRQSLMVTSVRKECFQDKMIRFCVIEGLLFMMRIAG